MSNQDIVTRNAPCAFDVESGQDYDWCSCGCGSAQPLADGGHQGANFTPASFSAEPDNTVDFYGRKQSADSILHDGAHPKL